MSFFLGPPHQRSRKAVKKTEGGVSERRGAPVYCVPVCVGGGERGGSDTRTGRDPVSVWGMGEV